MCGAPGARRRPSTPSSPPPRASLLGLTPVLLAPRTRLPAPPLAAALRRTACPSGCRLNILGRSMLAAKPVSRSFSLRSQRRRAALSDDPTPPNIVLPLRRLAAALSFSLTLRAASKKPALRTPFQRSSSAAPPAVAYMHACTYAYARAPVRGVFSSTCFPFVFTLLTLFGFRSFFLVF